jgi:hypothetical protein
MKGNREDSTFGDKLSEALLVLKRNIKKTFYDRKAKKAGMFLVLLFIGNVVKVFPEEITGTILFPPDEDSFGGRPRYTYYLDTTGNKIVDKTLVMSSYVDGNEVTNILKLYLTPGAKVVLETNNPASKTSSASMLVGVIMVDGTPLDFTEMFTTAGIKYYFPYLYAKLVRDGRVR